MALEPGIGPRRSRRCRARSAGPATGSCRRGYARTVAAPRRARPPAGVPKLVVERERSARLDNAPLQRVLRDSVPGTWIGHQQVGRRQPAPCDRHHGSGPYDRWRVPHPQAGVLARPIPRSRRNTRSLLGMIPFGHASFARRSRSSSTSAAGAHQASRPIRSPVTTIRSAPSVFDRSTTACVQALRKQATDVEVG